MTEMCFVVDADSKPLSPTKVEKAWFMIRHGKARLIKRFPMTIQLNRVIPTDGVCKDEVRCGIDDGSLHVGVALVQKCQTKNKVLFKGTIEQRKDVKKLITNRKQRRAYRRYNKRYRKARFNNRRIQPGWIPPTIRQKKQAIIRVVENLCKVVPVSSIWLEDVAFDVRALTDGYKPYKWMYQKSNRLDENIRRAIIKRDGKCMDCGKKDVAFEVHHIIPKRAGGNNTSDNLITLCRDCHDKTKNNEERFVDRYKGLIGTNRTADVTNATHVMQGKKMLHSGLKKVRTLYLTNGADTSNKRADWSIEKTHSNDAICITGFKPNNFNIAEWTIKPIRRRTKAKCVEFKGFHAKDVIEYTSLKGEKHIGYVTSLCPKKKELSFKDGNGKAFSKQSIGRCKVLYRPKGMYWFKKIS